MSKVEISSKSKERILKSTNKDSLNLGALNDNSVVAIIGGGPTGAGCALSLLKLAKENGNNPRIIIYEGKKFEKSTHYNQCVGVLSPPIKEILDEELNVTFPEDMTKRIIEGYVLHGNKTSLELVHNGSVSFAVRRVNFDEYLINEAKKQGAIVVQSRVTDIEIHQDCVRIYSESGNIKADVVVGAFGLDYGAMSLFERETPYRHPKYLDSIVTKLHPGMDFMKQYGNNIQAFLPKIREIEFGAVTPKYNHLTINIAGENISTNHMKKFLDLAESSNVLPPTDLWDRDELDFYKGRFPIGIADNFYGDRYVVAGDAAGMVRPFKGKGINSGIQTGVKAAKVMMNYGISKAAFKNYAVLCSNIINDLPYGKILRLLTIKLAQMKLIDPVLELGKHNKAVNKTLFDCVSAHESLRNVFKYMLKERLIGKITMQVLKKAVYNY